MTYTPRQFSKPQIALIEEHRKYPALRERIDERISILARLADRAKQIELCNTRVLGLPTGPYYDRERASIKVDAETAALYRDSDLVRLEKIEKELVEACGPSQFKDYHEEYATPPADSGKPISNSIPAALILEPLDSAREPRSGVSAESHKG